MRFPFLFAGQKRALPLGGHSPNGIFTPANDKNVPRKAPKGCQATLASHAEAGFSAHVRNGMINNSAPSLVKQLCLSQETPLPGHTCAHNIQVVARIDSTSSSVSTDAAVVNADVTRAVAQAREENEKLPAFQRWMLAEATRRKKLDNAGQPQGHRPDLNADKISHIMETAPIAFDPKNRRRAAVVSEQVNGSTLPATLKKMAKKVRGIVTGTSGKWSGDPKKCYKVTVDGKEWEIRGRERLPNNATDSAVAWEEERRANWGKTTPTETKPAIPVLATDVVALHPRLQPAPDYDPTESTQAPSAQDNVKESSAMAVVDGQEFPVAFLASPMTIAEIVSVCKDLPVGISALERDIVLNEEPQFLGVAKKGGPTFLDKRFKRRSATAQGRSSKWSGCEEESEPKKKKGFMTKLKKAGGCVSAVFGNIMKPFC